MIRIIPCLDIADGKIVKGVNFENLREMGDPIARARHYYEQGADELTFLDVTATVDGRENTYDLVTQTAQEIFIPLTVGGGISHVDHVARLLDAGADKVSINSAALKRPELIDEIAKKYGSQILVLSLDTKRENGRFVATTHGGRTSLDLDALSWTKEAIDRGVGEVLVNSIDADGTNAGFDIELLEAVMEFATVPVIASGGAGSVEHFVEVAKTGVQAILAASVFHEDRVNIPDIKRALKSAGYEVRDVYPMDTEELINSLKFDQRGLIPVVTQDATTQQVLMLGYMNNQALHETIKSGFATYFSRSRQRLWRKGETSGNTQQVVSIAQDCDADTLLLTVNQLGPACHTGTETCFTGREFFPQK